MEAPEVIQANGYFNGSNTKGNFDVQLKFKFPESELANALQFVAGIGRRLQVIAVIEKEKLKLGQYTVQQIKIDRDANCSIVLKSNKDDTFVDEFSKLLVEEAIITLKAKVLVD